MTFISCDEPVPNAPSPRRHRPQAFTLVELLVVISIIALLISLLLPALKSARDSAKASVCMSMVRQQVLAQYTYGIDYDGYYVPASAARVTGGVQGTWALTLVDGNYLPSVDRSIPFEQRLEQNIYTCPAREQYAQNSSVGGDFLLMYGVPLYINGLNPKGGGGLFGRNHRMTRIEELPEASRTLIHMEIGGVKTHSGELRFSIRPGPGPIGISNTSWSAPHQGANFGFADGHVERRRYDGNGINQREVTGSSFTPLDNSKWDFEVSQVASDTAVFPNEFTWSRKLAGLSPDW